jgi:hypothetical protein
MDSSSASIQLNVDMEIASHTELLNLVAWHLFQTCTHMQEDGQDLELWYKMLVLMLVCHTHICSFNFYELRFRVQVKCLLVQ